MEYVPPTGSIWGLVNPGLPNSNVLSFAVSSSNLVAGTAGGVYLSSDNGTSWNSLNSSLPNGSVYALAFSGVNLFAGTYGSGIYHSTNFGGSWTPENIGLSYSYIVALAVSGANVFAGTYGGTTGGVFLSTNNGTGWAAVNTELANRNVYALTPFGGNLFAGTDGSGIWRRPLSDMVASVERLSADVPEQFIVYQNFPNPFNPSTTIRYGLPNRSHVSLTVYNTLGQSVSTLMNGEQESGYHEVQFNATNLSSGVYFYRMQAGSYVETRKLLLVR
jgi:hypothetical protein